MGASGKKQRCVVNSMDATNEVIDMGLKSWAAAERCSTLEDSTVHCVVDITAVITSVSDFIKYILKAIDNCNPLKESNFACAHAGLKLESELMDLTSKSAKMTTECPNRADSIADPDVKSKTAMDRVSFGVCTLSIKDGMKSIGKAAASFTVHDKWCGANSADWRCADFSLTLAEHLVDIAKYIMNAVTHCGHSGLFHKGTHCFTAVTGVISALAGVGDGAAEIVGHCEEKAPERLYSATAESSESPTSMVSPLNAVLLALLPVTAIAGFVGGSRLQRGGRGTRVVTPVAPIE